MRTSLKILPYLAINTLAIYLLPLIVTDTSSAMMVLLTLLPAITLICSLLCAAKEGFTLVYPILIGILFVPSIFIYYNSSALVYSLAYAIIALFGCFIGWFIKKCTNKSTNKLLK